MKRVALSLVLCLAGGVQAAEPGQKVYAGEEAAALRCAHTMALTAIALSREAQLPEAQKNVMLEIAVIILDRHVSGTWRQKKAGLAIVRDRRGPVETLQDFQRFAAQCLRQFPIN